VVEVEGQACELSLHPSRGSVMSRSLAVVISAGGSGRSLKLKLRVLNLLLAIRCVHRHDPLPKLQVM
jgi:hypothetical protein